MLISRRRWLSITSAGAWGLVGAVERAVSAQADPGADVVARIRRLVDDFGRQGAHRTGTAVDDGSGRWLADEVRRIGAVPVHEPFSLSRVDPQPSGIIVDGRRIDGLPLFDAAFTAPAGVRGRLGAIGTDVEIGLVDAPPNTAAAGPLGTARRQARHTAIVCVTRGGRPGLCPNNADAFLEPFGPPVVQVSSDALEFLQGHALRGTTVQLVAAADRTPATSFNVTTTVTGASRDGRPPLVVMTPRSGWYACASERGGGLACWLELLRTVHRTPLSRDVIFVASSGHELGHLGINAFVANRADIVGHAVGWMHFGANIGAATRRDITVQASDDEREALLSQALTTAALTVSRRVPRGTVPGGEAEVVHRGGGRYVSVIGGSALFHHPDDRDATTVDAEAVAKFIRAFTSTARTLAA